MTDDRIEDLLKLINNYIKDKSNYFICLMYTIGSAIAFFATKFYQNPVALIVGFILIGIVLFYTLIFKKSANKNEKILKEALKDNDGYKFMSIQADVRKVTIEKIKTEVITILLIIMFFHMYYKH